MTARKNWDSYFMGIAQQVATRATCPRGQVGAVFVRDRDIVATGYNGSVPGAPHCTDLPEEVHVVNGHCDIVLHAEENGIIRAARKGTVLFGSEVYCTHRPCWPCTRRLLTVGVKRIVFLELYRPDPKVDELCALLGVPLVQLLPQVKCKRQDCKNIYVHHEGALYCSYECAKADMRTS